MVDLWWNVNKGYGFQQPDLVFPYDSQYLQKFQEYEKDEKTKLLNLLRTKLVNIYIKDDLLVDFGCGACTFIKSRENTVGYDVIPETVEWLKMNKKLFLPIYQFQNVCFWDSLEHLLDPRRILELIQGYVFISTPIYKNSEEVLHSKHYKPNEHIWYFSIRGLIYYMLELDFSFLCYSEIEKAIGRESIGTFVFRRYNAPTP